MNRHAKASSAASTSGHNGASSRAGRLALLTLIAAFLAIPATQASAEIAVNLSGTGAGTVSSDPAGISCSNVGGGAAGPTCGHIFPFVSVQLTAAPAADSYLAGWSGNDPNFFGKGTCNSGSANPCTVDRDYAAFGLPPTTITATFDLLPDPPVAVTGSAVPGADSSLWTLQGTVDPEEFKVGQCTFEYGNTSAYGDTTACADPSASQLDETSSTPEAVHAETEPLEPNTTYHYRLVASNLGGASEGEDRTFTTGPASVGDCPNEAIRQEQGPRVLHLSDCMALEMVSPPHKFGSPASNPNVSANGNRVTFVSQAALGANPAGLLSVGGATYVASRGQSGWGEPEMTVPNLKPRLADQWSTETERRPSFTPDFSRWFGIGSTEQQLPQAIARAYEAGLGGFFKPLSQPFGPLSFNSNSSVGDDVIQGTKFQAASADHSHLYFQPGAEATYFPGDPNGSGAELTGVYVARRDANGELTLKLLNRDFNDKVWGSNCGARLGGVSGIGSGGTAANGARGQGAVSANGSRTYFSARADQPQSGNCSEENKLRILERFETPNGPQIGPLFASECSRPSLPDPPGPCSGADGDDLYQGASLDQSKIYFTTNRQLTDTDIDGSGVECSQTSAVPGCDLYLYDRTKLAGERLTQVSAGEDVPSKHDAGREADVFNGITAISADGSHVYFVATGVLIADENPEGASATGGQPNLYLWDAHSEETTFLATLDPQDGITDASLERGRSLWGGEGTWRNGAYPVPVTENGGNGHILVFESKAELTEDDGDGTHLDAYRYDTEAETLECLSCAPGSSSSEPDEAPFDVTAHGEASLPLPAGTDFAERWRWVSEDGETVAFATSEGLLPGDVNATQDFYLWKEGNLVRLPGRPFADSQTPPEAVGPFLSHDGSTVAFVVVNSLLPQDGDTTADVYVARTGGGFPQPSPPQLCQGEECRGQPSAAPQLSGAGTAVLSGAGNAKPNPACRKGKVRRHGRCVAKHQRQAKKHQRSRRANNHRRAAK